VDTSRLRGLLARLSAQDIAAVDEAMLITLGLTEHAP
jgi:hypothetical protein